MNAKEKAMKWWDKKHIHSLYDIDVENAIDIALKEHSREIKDDWEDTFGEPVYLTEWNEFWKKYTGDEEE